ncbi:MAG: T9SS type A sorting domain-containing protein [Bacteroidia bacterium]|nr:T9SS type A sorting domain-containing protein [Bacteroidia bacterium]
MKSKKQTWQIVLFGIIFNALSLQAQVTVSTLVNFKGYGNADGPISTASFEGLWDVIMISGNFYLVEANGCRIRKLDVTNNVVSTITSCKSSTCCSVLDGPITTAQFFRPTRLATDKLGNIYVADLGGPSVRVIYPNGNVNTLAGSSIGYADGQGSSAKFMTVMGMAADNYGNIYVADQQNYKIRKITPGGFVTTFAGSVAGDADGLGVNARFAYPTGMVVDSKNNLYVADANNNKIRKIDTTGYVSTFAGSGVFGFVDGQSSAAQFRSPKEILIDNDDNIFVIDFGGRIIRHLDHNGIVTTIAGQDNQGNIDGPGSIAKFGSLQGGTCDGAGNIYIVDYNYSSIRKISYPVTLNSVKELKGNGISIYPNPSNDKVNIEIKDRVTITITDVSGHIVKSKELNVGANEINIQDLAPGIYFIRGQGVFNKIIKE